MASRLQRIAKSLWRNLWRFAGAELAHLAVPITTGADPARLEPGLLSWRDLGQIPILRGRAQTLLGTPPLGLGEDDETTLLTLGLVPLGARLTLYDRTLRVQALGQGGPGGLFTQLTCVPFPDAMGDTP